MDSRNPERVSSASRHLQRPTRGANPRPRTRADFATWLSQLRCTWATVRDKRAELRDFFALALRIHLVLLQASMNENEDRSVRVWQQPMD